MQTLFGKIKQAFIDFRRLRFASFHSAAMQSKVKHSEGV